MSYKNETRDDQRLLVAYEENKFIRTADNDQLRELSG